MKVLITGYGRMGRLIDETLTAAGDEIAGRIDIENVSELDAIRKKLMNIRDVVGSRRGQN